MFKLINVSLNHGRMRENVRSRLVETCDGLVFSWGAASSRKDARQSACRVQLTARGLAWDSGWVQTTEQSLRYGGEELPQATPIALSICIRDDAGEYSETYRNTFYNADVAWRAPFIGGRDEYSRTLYLRKEFSLDRPVAEATLYACGVGYQKVRINGIDADNAHLDPANTDYSKTCQYVMYPGIESKLRIGDNCLAVMLGSGWRGNILVSDIPNQHIKDRNISFAGAPALSAMLRLRFSDGEERWILTDGTWQCGKGAHAYNDIFNGETYDARETACGWDMPGFNGFDRATPVKAPGGKMRPMLIPPITEHKAHAPIALWPLDGGKTMIDFGQNIAGVVRIILPANMHPGQTIRLTHAEEIDGAGRLYTAPLRTAKATDTYIASGDRNDLSVWQSEFTYHGFRYACVEGLEMPLCVDDVRAIELHTDMDLNSQFRCGDALATKIHEICIETERGNQHSILTDCPQRDERQGWMNDATVRFESTPYSFDIGRIFPKIVRDIIDEQREDGAITCTAPFVFGNQPADPVCSSFLVAVRESLVHTGNVDLVRESYQSLCGWEKCLLEHSDGLIVNYSYYGDWAGPSYACEAEENPRSGVTPGTFMSTGYSFFNCRILESFAKLLNLPDDERMWREKAEQIRRAMLDKWYEPQTGKMATGSQGCQAFSLWLGLLPQSDIPKAAKLLHDDLAGGGYRLTTGNLCSRYILDVLTDFGYPEDAWKIITRQAYPSVGFMIQHEATTVWERYEQKDNPGMNSHNHPMYAALDRWFFTHLCGIKPTKNGWTQFEVKPFLPENLASAQASVDTILGEISVRWMRRYGKVHLMVGVPFGAQAEIVFGGKTHKAGSGFHTFAIEDPTQDAG